MRACNYCHAVCRLPDRGYRLCDPTSSSAQCSTATPQALPAAPAPPAAARSTSTVSEPRCDSRNLICFCDRVYT